MDTQNPSAPSRAQARVAGNNHPKRHTGSPYGGGLIHDNTRHTERFVVIGNHLTQHPELSLLAIGLGCHIQSLPRGAQVDIKSLAARFQEGATRIAAALRELEAHGYLRRERERVPGGRIVTRTISCNQPTAEHREPRPSDCSLPRQSAAAPKPKAPRKPLPAVPHPSHPHPKLIQVATDLLATLRRDDPRLLLSECDTAHLARGVAAWLERDVSPAAVRHALTADLPSEGQLRRPAALLAHRLATQLPPPPPFRASVPAPPSAVRHPLQNCDGCDRAFRSPNPGRCHDCRTPVAHAA
ncbi:helix-turn-helix domain-containing protein [Streptomyces sp. NPDC091215]|uniref:helix-turn-helix domain-containing protein n=1 Tax=Streptomyces sp. NPDC091215 TaxID=3155192 RepID=UPI00341DE63C